MLRDRNTVRMVAEHWGCSVATVYRRLDDGTLPCLWLQGMIRITREQVEAYEATCTTAARHPVPAPPAAVQGPTLPRSSGSTRTAAGTSYMGPNSSAGFLAGQRAAQRLNNFSRTSNSAEPPAP